jgi:hypothetical protein
MICFRDMTFCASDCANDKCRRHFGEDDKEAAEKWMLDPPIAWSDFSKDCEEYQKP